MMKPPQLFEGAAADNTDSDTKNIVADNTDSDEYVSPYALLNKDLANTDAIKNDSASRGISFRG